MDVVFYHHSSFVSGLTLDVTCHEPFPCVPSTTVIVTVVMGVVVINLGTTTEVGVRTVNDYIFTDLSRPKERRKGPIFRLDPEEVDRTEVVSLSEEGPVVYWSLQTGPGGFPLKPERNTR